LQELPQREEAARKARDAEEAERKARAAEEKALRLQEERAAAREQRAVARKEMAAARALEARARKAAAAQKAAAFGEWKDGSREGGVCRVQPGRLRHARRQQRQLRHRMQRVLVRWNPQGGSGWCFGVGGGSSFNNM
jgi:hypothetical protein